MSNLVFPTLPGLAWNVSKTPIWKTDTKTTASGRELRVGYWSYPRYKFKLVYEFLRADANQELQTLMGFFHQMKGGFDTFLYQDPTDYQVNAGQFGTGDGSTTVFQLQRILGGYSEPIYNPVMSPAPQIFANGAAAAGVNVDATGKVTFNTAPASGVALTWTGSFYFRCKFNADQYDFDNFMKQLWEAKQIELMSVKA